ncbi:MAG: HAD family hydrolase [Desulforhopalus sp.]|jgi:phosphoglycolate phosphatase|nr:HAD family hydrolase [Desulforhopalus sp.]
MPYKSIIFDLDGTLLDTLPGLARTGNAVLARFGYPLHSADAYRQFVGDGMDKLVERMLPKGVDQTARSQAAELYREIYTATWREECRPYPGIVAMLDQLRDREVKLAVLSNKPHPFTEQFVEAFLDRSRFMVVYGERPGLAKKPDPAVALMILDHLACPPEHSVFVGDSAVDIFTGKAAGMAALGAGWGFRGAAELLASGALKVFTEPLELVDYVSTPL